MEQHDDNALIIYTDGSMLPRPRRGGFAFRVLWTDADGYEQHEDYAPEGQLGATNNEIELKACVEALRLVTGRRSPVPRDAYRKIVVYVDSAYICNHIGTAQTTWPETGWMGRSGEPVLNADLWQELIRFKQKAGRVDFRKVKAHQRKDKRNPGDAQDCVSHGWSCQCPDGRAGRDNHDRVREAGSAAAAPDDAVQVRGRAPR
jgi:ribonuclease HI